MSDICLTKICSKCNKEKPITEFYYNKTGKDQLTSRCKDCYYDANSTYYHSSPKEKTRKQIWWEQNPNYMKGYTKNKRETDDLYNLSCNIRGLIHGAFSNNNYKKQSRTEEILGCTIPEFKIHLEYKFKPWMNWDNYGKYNGQLNYGWDIDHHIPMAFIYVLPENEREKAIYQLNHYRNLQPLCSYTNRYIKKDRFDWVD